MMQMGQLHPYSTATVTVNGQTLPFSPPSVYYAHPTLLPAPGSSMELRVTVPEGEITAHQTLPATATITAPSEGSRINTSDALSLTWTIASDPGEFHFYYTGVDRRFVHYLDVVPGSARSLNMPANTLPEDTSSICIYAVNSGTSTLTGPFASGSTFRTVGRHDCKNVTTTAH
jgi:hypothetical protein